MWCATVGSLEGLGSIVQAFASKRYLFLVLCRGFGWFGSKGSTLFCWGLVGLATLIAIDLLFSMTGSFCRVGVRLQGGVCRREWRVLPKW